MKWPNVELRPYRADMPRDAASWGEGQILSIGGLSNTCSVDLSSLDSFEMLYGLNVQNARIFDLQALYRRSELKHLAVDETIQPVDYTRFPNLEWLHLAWNRNATLPLASSRLRRLALWSYRNPDLKGLPRWEALERLKFVQASIRALDGIEEFPALEELELHSLRNLMHVWPLGRSARLTSVRFEACRQIADIEALSQSRTLQELVMVRCGDLPSLGFISRCPSLRNVRLIKTYVADGDVSPLARLETAVFDAKAHYTHSEAQIQTLIRERGERSGEAR